jgi:hypothetical protein
LPIDRNEYPNRQAAANNEPANDREDGGMSGNWTVNKSLKWAGAAAVLVVLAAVAVWYVLGHRSQ